MSQLLNCFFLLLILVAGHGVAQESNEPPVNHLHALDFEAIANMLVARMDLQHDERVVFVGKPGRFDLLIEILRRKVTESGGEDLGVFSITRDQPPDWSSEFTAGLQGLSREATVGYLSDMDLAVMLPGATPADEVYAAIQDVLKRGLGRAIHFHWAGAYSIDNQALEINPQIDAFYQNAILNTDYAALVSRQKEFEAAARSAMIRVTTPAGTDLVFETGDRPVTMQDGDASAARAGKAENLIDREVEIPSGAIRVAPVEESVNGIIVFPDMQWNGEWVRGLRMEFRRGKVVSYQAESNPAAVDAELSKAGDSGKSFREFALGMNPALVIPAAGKPWIPYYGYGAGIVRLSLGDNTELGGKVGGGYVRWNFFTDASVTIGDQVWVAHGKAMK